MEQEPIIIAKSQKEVTTKEDDIAAELGIHRAGTSSDTPNRLLDEEALKIITERARLFRGHLEERHKKSSEGE